MQQLKSALLAVQKHINDYATLGKGNLTGLQKIVDEMKGKLSCNRLSTPSSDIIKREEMYQFVKKLPTVIKNIENYIKI